NHLEVNERLQGYAAHAFQIAAARNARNQRSENEWRHDRADQPQEYVRDRAQLPGETRRPDSKEDSHHEPDQRPRRERRPFHRSPHLSFWRRTSKNIMRGGRISRSANCELRHTIVSPSRTGVPVCPSIVRYTLSSGPRDTTRITLVSGTSTGRLVSMCGQIGVMQIAGTEGKIIG